MKILFYTDVHWSTYSSIFRRRGSKYSQRLESCIESVSWAEQLAEELEVDLIVCGGDFFDQKDLRAEELTALQEVKFSTRIPRIFLVGNHELYTSDKEIASSHLFTLIPNTTVVSQPSKYDIDETTSIVFLPYISESERKPLSEYTSDACKPIVFSHNDIAGIQMGKFVSTAGFSVDEIEQNCGLFINGHLHNEAIIGSQGKIINVGNLTGQNFGEDGLKYNHKAVVVDTDTLSVMSYVNPYCARFFNIDTRIDKDYASLIPTLPHYSCVMVRCLDNETTGVKELLNNNINISNYRIVTYSDCKQLDQVPIVELSKIDHVKSFKEYVTNELGNDANLLKELEQL